MVRLGRTEHVTVSPKLVRHFRVYNPQIVAMDVVVARTFTDDVDMYRQMASGSSYKLRPGLRDDDTTKFFGKLLPVFYIKET